jgi:hypothetical protein
VIVFEDNERGAGTTASQRTRREHLDRPYPAGESWREATQRVLIIGHMATRWGLEHHLNGVPLEDLADAPFRWQPGWEYRLRRSSGTDVGADRA